MTTFTAPTTPASTLPEETLAVPAPVPTSASAVSRADLFFAAALAAASALVMFNAWRDIWRLGTHSEELSYVLLAPVMIVWLAWSRRERLQNCALRGQWLGFRVDVKVKISPC